ncbi:MAG: amidase [Xanthobacteraceae bacterium]|nr:amidase [Xanthobacteraceae bacterium]
MQLNKLNVSQDSAAEPGVLDLIREYSVDSGRAAQYLNRQLEKAKALEPVLHAFEYLPQTLEVASSGPMAGVPMAVKDIISTFDMPTTNGSAMFRDHIPANDAWVVRRLRDLGGTVFGKTVLTEFAWRHPGATVNPWNPKHTPGGSSSGSAASVAAGLVPLAFGTQTLGSTVRPAAFNGVVGLKPSYGAIPRVGVHHLSPSLDHIGFFARQVDDVAYALSQFVGTSDLDLHGRPLPPFHVPIDNGLTSLEKPRIAVMRLAQWSRAEPEQQKLFEDTVKKLRAAGAILKDIDYPEMDRDGWQSTTTILACEASVIFDSYIAAQPDKISDAMKQLVESGKSMSAYDYLAAKRFRDKQHIEYPKLVSDFDIVLTLPALGEAPEGLDYTGDAEYCAPWTLLGVPAIALPAGFGKNGLPLGIQVVGKYREDLRMLRAAKWIEKVLDFQPGTPALAASL